MNLDRTTLLNTAQRALEKQEFEKAIRAYQALLRLDPHDVRIILKLAEVYLRTHATKDAIQLYLSLASHYEQEGDTDKLGAIYGLVLKIDPFQQQAHEALFELTGQQQKQEA